MEAARGDTAVTFQQGTQDQQAVKRQVQSEHSFGPGVAACKGSNSAAGAMSPYPINYLLNPDQRAKFANRPIYSQPEIEYLGPSYRSSSASTPERAVQVQVPIAVPAEIPVPVPQQQETAAVGTLSNEKVENDIQRDQAESGTPMEAVTSSNGKRGTKRANEKQLVPGRRAEQNRKAQEHQTAFRDRQAMRMRDLESQVETLGAQMASAKQALVENNELRKYICSLQSALRQASVPCPEPPASLDQNWRLKGDSGITNDPGIGQGTNGAE